MILPVFILIADIGAWWLTREIAALGDTALTAMCGSLAIALVVWLIIEVYQLSENAIPSGRSDTDYFE